METSVTRMSINLGWQFYSQIDIMAGFQVVYYSVITPTNGNIIDAFVIDVLYIST